MGHGFTTAHGDLIDAHGRTTLLRGVNLSGDSKLPFAGDSFVGRPAPLDEVDTHLARIAGWGFNCLRLLTTWEAIEHAGPGDYDEAYLDHYRAVAERAGQHGLFVVVDPHQDVWSRWTGGDGAPRWAFDAVPGLVADRFAAAQAVELGAVDWPAGYDRAPVATMFTLFLAGDRFLPELAGVQGELQSRYAAAVAALAERVADLDHVIGYDTLNEPSYGYLGRGDDLAEGRRFFDPDRPGPGPFSALEHLAAADGVTVRHDDGGVLNPDGVSVWDGGCPWRRAGVWDLDGAGRPVLGDPTYFTERDGRLVHPWSDHVVPFVRRVRDAVRSAHPGCLLFVECSPFDLDTPWDDPDPLVVNARHWYDVRTLTTRRFDPDERPVETVAAGFAEEIEDLRRRSLDQMGGLPLFVGEFGIPYDLNGGEAFRTGDWQAQETLLDACYRAVERCLVGTAQWNYTPGNTHEHGDGWNGEDLSMWSAQDGARAERAFCRPYVRSAAGAPRYQSFDPATRHYALELDTDEGVHEPTVVFVPRLHYPAGVDVEVSAGTVEVDEARQLLRWRNDWEPGPSFLDITPA